MKARWMHGKEYSTLFEIEEANKEARQSFFDSRRHDAWARIFDSRITHSRCFVSGEAPGEGWFASDLAKGRRYSLHIVCEDGTIDTVGWLTFETLGEAFAKADAIFGRQDALI